MTYFDTYDVIDFDCVILLLFLKNCAFRRPCRDFKKWKKNGIKSEYLVFYWVLAHCFKIIFQAGVIWGIQRTTREIRDVDFSGYFLWCLFWDAQLMLGMNNCKDLVRIACAFQWIVNPIWARYWCMYDYIIVIVYTLCFWIVVLFVGGFWINKIVSKFVLK